MSRSAPSTSAKAVEASRVSAAPAGGRVRGSDRKTQITRETLRLVAEHGIQGTSMSRISAAVGVSSAALYRHFESRDDILIAAFDTLMDRFTLWLEISDAPCAVDRLRHMCERHASMFSQDIEGWNVPMFQFTVYIPKDRVREHVHARRTKMFEAVGQIIDEGKAQGCIAPDVDVKQAVADLYAWIYWEDLSYLEGLDHEFTERDSAEMYERILKRISAESKVLDKQ
ncbi:MAG: TetR/AcrR family transcriptional regulator [Actinobacteria bacterium]|nr:TetR/AcrR family transcriptional regulator [Actinomycetota bacterium]